jgi:hypothetical protein
MLCLYPACSKKPRASSELTAESALPIASTRAFRLLAPALRSRFLIFENASSMNQPQCACVLLLLHLDTRSSPPLARSTVCGYGIREVIHASCEAAQVPPRRPTPPRDDRSQLTVCFSPTHDGPTHIASVWASESARLAAPATIRARRAVPQAVVGVPHAGLNPASPALL